MTDEGEEVLVISGVSKIVVPVEDEVAAKEFGTPTVGFEVASDQT